MSSHFLALFLLVLAPVSTKVAQGATNTLTTSPSPSVSSSTTLTPSWSISLPSMTAIPTASHTYTTLLSASLSVSPQPTGTQSLSVTSTKATPTSSTSRSTTRTKHTRSSPVKTATVQLTSPPILDTNDTNGNSSRMETVHTNQSILTCGDGTLTKFTTRPTSLQLKILLEYDHGIIYMVTPRIHGDPLLIPNGTFEIWNEDESVKLGPLNTTSFSDEFWPYRTGIHVAGAFWVYATLEASIKYTPGDVEGIQIFVRRKLSANDTGGCDAAWYDGIELCEVDLELESGVPWTFGAISVSVTIVSLILGQVLKLLAKKEKISQQTFITLSFVSCLSILVTRCLVLYFVYDYVKRQPDAAYCDVDFNCPGQVSPERKDPQQWQLIMFLVYYTFDFIVTQVVIWANDEPCKFITIPARFITDQCFSLGLDAFFVSARADDGAICLPIAATDLSEIALYMMLGCLFLWVVMYFLFFVYNFPYIIGCTSNDSWSDRKIHCAEVVLKLRYCCFLASSMVSMLVLVVRLINITEYIVIPAVAHLLATTISLGIAAIMAEIVQRHAMVSAAIPND